MSQYLRGLFSLDGRVAVVTGGSSGIVSYAAERKLNLISATEPLDLSGAMGLMAATTLAFVGQMESENTSARVKNTQQHFRQIGRWRGSVPPYGYRPARVDGKPGWWLEIDPESAIVAREAADRVLAGESVNALASDFNDRVLPAPFDRARDLQGKPRLCACGHDAHDEPCSKLHKCRHRVKVTGHKQVKAHELDECSQPCPEYRPKRWARESIMQILRSPALFGHTVEDGHVLLGDDGMPIAFAPGVIDPETWTRLQERLDARSYQKVPLPRTPCCSASPGATAGHSCTAATG